MQNPILSPVCGMYWPHDNVIVDQRESKVLGAEDEVVLNRKGHGFGFRLQCGELYATRAARLPVLSLGEDFDGENGVRA